MKVSCPAVLLSFVKVQSDTWVVPAGVRYTIDPGLETKVDRRSISGLETKVQLIAVNVPSL